MAHSCSAVSAINLPVEYIRHFVSAILRPFQTFVDLFLRFRDMRFNPVGIFLRNVRFVEVWKQLPLAPWLFRLCHSSAQIPFLSSHRYAACIRRIHKKVLCDFRIPFVLSPEPTVARCLRLQDI